MQNRLHAIPKFFAASAFAILVAATWLGTQAHSGPTPAAARYAFDYEPLGGTSVPDGLTVCFNGSGEIKVCSSPTFTGTVVIPTLHLTNPLGTAYGGTGNASPGDTYSSPLSSTGNFGGYTVSCPTCVTTAGGQSIAGTTTLGTLAFSGGGTGTIASTSGSTVAITGGLSTTTTIQAGTNLQTSKHLVEASASTADFAGTCTVNSSHQCSIVIASGYSTDGKCWLSDQTTTSQGTQVFDIGTATTTTVTPSGSWTNGDTGVFFCLGFPN